MESLSIVGLGQISNVGSSVETSCAAQRAGIRRLAPVEGITSYDPDTLEEPVLGASIEDVRGFFHSSRWVTLANLALRDLARHVGTSVDDATHWKSTALYWLVPTIDAGRLNVPTDLASDFLQTCCADVFYPLSRTSIPRDGLRFFDAGPVGAGLACLEARQRLRAGDHERVLLLATDSWLDPMSLMYLTESERLKAPPQPVGFLPGEGAACVLLERSGRRRGSGRVLGAAVPPPVPKPDAANPATWRKEASKMAAQAIVEAVREAFAVAHIDLPFRGDVIVDLNGEEWRASAWGQARAGLATLLDATATREIYPALSYGDLGAVGSIAALCIAARSFARDYASGPRSLIVSVSERGRASAIVVGRDQSP